MREQHTLKALQEGELELKQELACIGFTLSNEQMKELYRVQQMALLRYRWVETRRECIFDILKPFFELSLYGTANVSIPFSTEHCTVLPYPKQYRLAGIG
ncbi:hypothetical protein HMPREF0983_01601 [Erysipelotrichaceae bacterium 3_1_53]|nr:hypothetical protein HMPREF0983_01601 [Erysipelotrichaceae bacterium 3_1_53]